MKINDKEVTGKKLDDFNRKKIYLNYEKFIESDYLLSICDLEDDIIEAENEKYFVILEKKPFPDFPYGLYIEKKDECYRFDYLSKKFVDEHKDNSKNITPEQMKSKRTNKEIGL